MQITNYKTARARAQGLGSAHEGTHHWWSQRLTSIALVPLTIAFIVPFGRALGSDHATVVATYSDPVNAIVAALFIGVTFYHHHQGVQVVVQDYVHDKRWLAGGLALNWLVCGAAGLAGVFAVLKLAFAG